MTDLFTVSVDAVDGATLRGRVHIINPDAAFVPEGPGFPVAVLMDAWWLLSNGYLGDGHGMPWRPDRCPFSVEEGRAIVSRMRLKEEFAEIHAMHSGRKVRFDDDMHLLTDDGATVAEPERLVGAEHRVRGGGSRDEVSRYITTPRDPEGFSRRAADAVVSYEAGPLRNMPPWGEAADVLDPEHPLPADLRDELALVESEDDLLEDGLLWSVIGGASLEEHPYAEFTAVMSDAGYLEHVVGGMRWSTAVTGHV